MRDCCKFRKKTVGELQGGDPTKAWVAVAMRAHAERRIWYVTIGALLALSLVAFGGEVPQTFAAHTWCASTAIGTYASHHIIHICMLPQVTIVWWTWRGTHVRTLAAEVLGVRSNPIAGVEIYPAARPLLLIGAVMIDQKVCLAKSYEIFMPSTFRYQTRAAFKVILAFLDRHLSRRPPSALARRSGLRAAAAATFPLGVSTLSGVSPAAHPCVAAARPPRRRFSRGSGSMQRSQPGHLTKSPHQPTTSVSFLRTCNDIEAATHRRTGQCSSVLVLCASSPTLVDAATTPEAMSTAALLASLSQWEWPSLNWLDAIMSMP
eukprot:351801-Chlamydomonas_euryale.AAC.14